MPVGRKRPGGRIIETLWRRTGMSSYRLDLDTQPVPKPRPRVVRGKGGSVHAFTPRKAERAEDQIRQAWIDRAYPLLEGPLVVEVTVVLDRPKSHYGTGKNAGTLKAGAPQLVITRPDLDNYAKTALDALNGTAWTDDAHIVELALEKRYGARPGWRILVEEA